MRWWKIYGAFGNLCALGAGALLLPQNKDARVFAGMLAMLAVATRQQPEPLSPWRRYRDAIIARLRGSTGPTPPWLYIIGFTMASFAQLFVFVFRPGPLPAIVLVLGIGMVRRGMDQKLPAALWSFLARNRTKTVILLPPGSACRRVIDFLYSSKTVSRVFEPILADMQTEWVEAIVQGHVYKARWIQIRGYYELLTAAGFHSFLKALRPIISVFTRSA